MARLICLRSWWRYLLLPVACGLTVTWWFAVLVGPCFVGLVALCLGVLVEECFEASAAACYRGLFAVYPVSRAQGVAVMAVLLEGK